MASQAIVHVVRGGGARNVSRISSQWNYLTRKGRLQLQFSERHGGGFMPYDEQRVWAQRWAEQAGNYIGGEAVGDPDQAMTTHIVVSFPPGTDHGAAHRAGRAWAAEMFGSEEYAGEFDYFTAFHIDREHPHLHVIVNRRSLSPGHEWLKIARRNERINYDLMRARLVVHSRAEGIHLLANARVPGGYDPLSTREHFTTSVRSVVAVHEHWEDETVAVFRDDPAWHQQAGGGAGPSGDHGPGPGVAPDPGPSRHKRAHEAETSDDVGVGPSSKRPRTGAPVGGSHQDGSDGGSGSHGDSLSNGPSSPRIGSGAPPPVRRIPSEDLYNATPRQMPEPRSEGRPVPAPTGSPVGGSSGGGSQSMENTVDDALRGQGSGSASRVETDEERRGPLGATRAHRDLEDTTLTPDQTAEEDSSSGLAHDGKRKREDEAGRNNKRRRDHDGRS